ncbi:MAG: prepilin peptidase [Chloroflexi bacterium]|nr:prepilin peptidase [Chloroflexota bacterium]
MIEVIGLGLAGLGVGAAANIPVERLPRIILATDGASENSGGNAAAGTRSRPGSPSKPWIRRVLLAIAVGFLFAFSAYRFDGEPLRAGTAAAFSAVFLTLAVIDFENQLLPDLIVFPALAVALATSPFQPHLNPWEGAAGAALGFFVFLPLWGWGQLRRQGQVMGFGDVKFTAMMGAALGLQFLGVALYAGVILGGIVAVTLFVALRGRRPRVIPFGTFLATGGLIALFYGRPIVDWALNVLG